MDIAVLVKMKMNFHRLFTNVQTQMEVLFKLSTPTVLIWVAFFQKDKESIANQPPNI